MLAALIAVALLSGFMIAGLRGAVWVPARSRDTVEILASLKLSADVKIFEFGCGDGRNLHLIHRALPKATLAAIEINPVMWLIAVYRTGTFAKIRLGDGWRAKVSGYDVVMTFLTPPFMARFETKMLAELKPGALVVSYAFELPNLQPLKKQNNYFIYKVPD